MLPAYGFVGLRKKGVGVGDLEEEYCWGYGLGVVLAGRKEEKKLPEK